MRELMAAIDELAAEDLFPLTGRATLDRTTLITVAINRLQAEQARTVRHAECTQAPEDDGMRSMASWLRGHCRLSTAEAARVVRRGRAIDVLPAVAAGFADGGITAEQVTVAAAVTTPEHLAAAAAQDVDLPEIDAALARLAVAQPFQALGQAVHHYLAQLDPDGTEPDPTEGRTVWMTRHADGRRSFGGELDAVGGEKFELALESIVQASRPQGDLRTRGQQQGDALVQLCDLALASGRLPQLRTVKPHVGLTLTAADFFDPHVTGGLARLGFGPWVTVAQARAVACDGRITPILLNPHGQPVDIGRTQRFTPPHIRRAVEVRDEHCVFAGCDAPAYWCDVHHLLEWDADHGDTSVENSGLLCERHHTKAHHGFRIERDPEGRWHTYRPDGSEIRTEPRLDELLLV